MVRSNAWMERKAVEFFYESGHILSRRAVSILFFLARCSRSRRLFIADYIVGAQKALIKSEKAKSPRSEHRLALLQEAARISLFSDTGGKGSAERVFPAKPRLLDVGSCYNPFKRSEHADKFDVTGDVRELRRE